MGLWLSSGAYTHCLLILPIFFYMLWFNQHKLRDLEPRPALWGGAVIAAAAGLWLLAFLSGVAEAEQFALIGVVQGILLTLFGWRIYLRLLLPFSYLWLLVPSGEFLIPPLQGVTARTAAWLLEMAGLPTYRDGVSIDVPSGSYVVAPGCAGLNFVLAGLATSLAYAELVYRSWARRIGFILALLAVAVLGNCLRVFLIIGIAHLTGNVGDIIDDHLLYGWGFFSLLLLGVMHLGQRFRDPDPLAPPSPPAASAPFAGVPAPAFIRAALLCALLVAAAPTALRLVTPAGAAVFSPLPDLSCAPLSPFPADADWPATLPQGEALRSVDCGLGGQRLHLGVAVLRQPIRQSRLLGLESRLGGAAEWGRIERSTARLTAAGRSLPVLAELQSRGARRRLVWSLFWAGGDWRAPGFSVALADLRGELAGRRQALLLQAATDVTESEAAAAALLRQFLAAQPLDRLAADSFSSAGGRESGMR